MLSRKTDFLLATLALAVIVGFAALLTRAPDSERTGLAVAIDGDSLRIGAEQIRLRGIDAPEKDQTCRRGGEPWTCGEAAWRALRALLSRGLVTCVGAEHDRYGRLLAVCRVLGRDINAEMVSGGLAVSYGDYAAQEREARADARGLWSGSFDRPQDWRRLHPRTTP